MILRYQTNILLSSISKLRIMYFSRDTTLKVWCGESLDLVQNLGGHTSAVTAVKLLPSQRFGMRDTGCTTIYLLLVVLVVVVVVAAAAVVAVVVAVTAVYIEVDHCTESDYFDRPGKEKWSEQFVHQFSEWFIGRACHQYSF